MMNAVGEQDLIAAHLRHDGKVAVRLKDGTPKLVWPIDAREMVAANKGTKLIPLDEPLSGPHGNAAKAAPFAQAAATIVSPKSLQAPPSRMPGRQAASVPSAPSAPPPPSMSPHTGAPPLPDKVALEGDEDEG